MYKVFGKRREGETLIWESMEKNRSSAWLGTYWSNNYTQKNYAKTNFKIATFKTAKMK